MKHFLNVPPIDSLLPPDGDTTQATDYVLRFSCSAWLLLQLANRHHCIRWNECSRLFVVPSNKPLTTLDDIINRSNTYFFAYSRCVVP